MVEHRERLRDRLLVNEQELVGYFLDSLRQEIPAYTTLDPAQVREVEDITRWILRKSLELWIADGILSDSDRRRFRAIGAVRARDGRPLVAVLRAYRIGAAAFLERIVPLLAGEVTALDVAALTRVWLAVLDQLSEAIFEGYEWTGRSLADHRERELATLLTDIVLGRQSHESALAARLRELRTTLPRTFDLIVAGRETRERPADAEDLAKLRAAAVSDPIAHGEAEFSGLGAVFEDKAILAVSATDQPRLHRALRERKMSGCVVSSTTSRDAPRWYRLATCALAYYSLEFGDLVRNRGDLEVLALVSGHRDADPARTAHEVLGPLASQTPLIDALRAVIATGGAPEAAQQLHVHPQTIRYRMRRIGDLTGRHPLQRPWDRFALQAALIAANRQ
ncbi:PucR family transcriptional regulator [Nocardia beijingensis]